MALKVGNVIQVWKNFDLPALQRELDTEAAEVARRQDESDAGRRRLIDLSREFKKTASEDVKAAVAPLLKNFQAEVDSLNKRSKAAEVVFLNVYKKLTDINDPVPLLEMIPSLQQKISRQQDLEMEVKQLRDTLAEYNEEFRQVRNQDVTIKQLKEKLRQAEDLLDSTVQARLKENEEKLSRHFEERERELMELNSVATRRLTETEGRIAALQATVSELQSELFDARSKADEAAYAKSEEMEMLMMDLERANQRCLLAEKEVVSLKEQLLAGSGRGQTNEAPPSADTPLDMMARPSSLQLELSAKEKEVQSLIEDVQRLQSTLAELRESSAQQLARLEEELQLRSKHIQRLETQLEAQKDYEEIRRELGVLKSIEFPHVAMGSNSSATSTAAESGPESGSGSEGKPLELLLLERNKTLQSENTELKVSNTDLQARLEQLKNDNEVLESSEKSLKNLVEQLERDLSNIQSFSMSPRGEAEGQATATDWVAEAVKDLGKPSTDSVPPADSDTAATLLPILQAQRERFRMRNQELETQILEKQEQMGLLHSEMERLRADNVALYEKVRYLQSYSAQRSAAVALSGTEERYERQYEERLDPFASFSRKERQRKLAQLGPFEKITYSMGQVIVSSRAARTGTVVYLMLLHALVFMVLYRLAYTESCHRDMAAECAQKFDSHMQEVHGLQFHL